MFHYYHTVESIARDNPTAFVALVPGGEKTERGLVQQVKMALCFPAYCGANFDAFWDCVRDLDGIDQKWVILAHRDLPPLPEVEREIYIALLRDAVLYWEKYSEEHCFEVWFPHAEKKPVEAILAACPPPLPTG